MGIVGRNNIASLSLTEKKSFSGKGPSTCLENAVICEPFLSSNRIMLENLGITEHTSINWHSFSIELCQFGLEHVQNKLGGPGVEVKIDETLDQKKKKKSLS